MPQGLPSSEGRGPGEQARRAAAIAACLLSACAAPQVVPDAQEQPTPGAGAGYAGMVVEQRPSTFLSSWHAANWSARSAALAAAGLTAVQLTPLPAGAVATVEIPPGTWCQRVKVRVGGQTKVALFNISGDFAVTQAGELHCLKIENPSLGDKTVNLDGQPPNCGTGSVMERAERSRFYAIPSGVATGEMITLSAPTFNIAIRYAESCPPLP